MNIPSSLRISVLAVAAGLVVSCGTTSNLKPTVGALPGSKKYTKVIVKDFNSSVAEPGVRTKVELAKKTFADQIQGEIQKTGAFRQVARSGKPDAGTLVISGTITKYEEGNAALRLMVGLGAGSSRFDATVNFHDGASSKPLGSILVDKNSWVLGGMIAATQGPEDYMPGAAKKIASEASSFGSVKP